MHINLFLSKNIHNKYQCVSLITHLHHQATWGPDYNVEKQGVLVFTLYKTTHAICTVRATQPKH